jgi:hypothetical protein
LRGYRLIPGHPGDLLAGGLLPEDSAYGRPEQ